MIPVLQLRWKLQEHRLIYYGLPSKPNTFRRTRHVGSHTRTVIQHFDGITSLEQFPSTPLLRKLIRKGIIVDVSMRRQDPSSLQEAVFCKRCAANDYSIPGLQLDAEGLCPLCSYQSRFRKLKNVLPSAGNLRSYPDRQYDAAVFYTGGKDSSYLLYYLSEVLHLRILALTWLIPFMSENALQSMENAKKRLPNVTFLAKALPDEQLRPIYQKLYSLQKNTCACPSVAYVLFYPLLLQYRVPCLLLGNEPAQCKNLIFNQMAPAFSYHPASQFLLRLGYNLGRLCTGKKTFRKGQMELYETVRALAFGNRTLLRFSPYRNELVENVCSSLHEVPELMKPFMETVSRSSRRGDIPALLHLDLNNASGGIYEWETIKKELEDKLGWVDCAESQKGLHTSCKIERCKEYSQWTRFHEMESRMIPFSAIELSVASGEGAISREEAIRELQTASGLSDVPPEELACMLSYLEDNKK